jgi:guanosine-3',5'-bis(diphosphate) 3'-pyrophosphohydrolase
MNSEPAVPGIKAWETYTPVDDRRAESATLEEVLERVHSYGGNRWDNLITRAHQFAEEAHRGQVRKSGLPYITHPLAVAHILAELEQDGQTVAVGILHDVIEDCQVTPEELQKCFGEQVASLVEGVTKVSQLGFRLRKEEDIENVRRMLMAMARDIRVVIIKLCDRLHNMRTLRYLPLDTRLRIARSTLDIYAPLANRMGIGWIKWQLEDLAMLHLHPEEYRRIRNAVDTKREEREAYIHKVRAALEQKLAAEGINGQVVGRAKHFYSIHQKMLRDNCDLGGIYDLLGLRIFTATVADCYAVLGVVHSLWPPLDGRFRDYISAPKPNGYKSLHTTVFGPGGHVVEVQIRTPEMHRIAEEGVAAHWRYKEKRADSRLRSDAKWLLELSRFLRDTDNPEELLASIKTDLFSDEIYVYTPKGDVVRLPVGSSPIDFAYKIHSKLGENMAGAKVGNRFVPLSYALKTGDIVEIIRGHGAHPHADWLKMARTSRARSKIRRYLQDSQRETLLEMGRAILNRQLARIGKDVPAIYTTEQMTEIIESLDCKGPEDLWVRIGFGQIDTKQIIGRFLHRGPRKREHVEEFVGDTIRVQQIDGVQYRRARCCNPLPGEPIIGIVTRGRGISIHREDCINIRRFTGDNGRKIKLSWDTEGGESYEVILSVLAKDRKRLLADLSSQISSTGTNISGSRSHHHGKDGVKLHFTVEVADIDHLNRVVRRLIDIEGVQSVIRRKASRPRVAFGPTRIEPRKQANRPGAPSVTRKESHRRRHRKAPRK